VRLRHDYGLHLKSIQWTGGSFALARESPDN
jgi:hypothetical protein